MIDFLSINQSPHFTSLFNLLVVFSVSSSEMHRIHGDVWMNFDIKSFIWGNWKRKFTTKAFIKWDFEWALSAYVFISCLIEVKPSKNLIFCSNETNKNAFWSQWKIVLESIEIQHYITVTLQVKSLRFITPFSRLVWINFDLFECQYISGMFHQ